jgi:hypothetical protein
MRKPFVLAIVAAFAAGALVALTFTGHGARAREKIVGAAPVGIDTHEITKNAGVMPWQSFPAH